MKKIFKILLTVLIFGLLQSYAFAAEEPLYNEENSIEYVNGNLVIHVDSQEEYDLLVKQIEENNQKVARLWENAINESQTQSDENEIMPAADSKYYSVSVTVKLDKPLKLRNEKFYHSLRGHVTTEASPRFIDYTYVGVTPANTEVSITDVTNDVVALDSGRTYAVNSSFFATVDLMGATDTYPIDFYTEFYANGSGINYN